MNEMAFQRNSRRKKSHSETIISIARLYRVSVPALRDQNPELDEFFSDEELPNGLTLRVPHDGFLADVIDSGRLMGDKSETIQEIARAARVPARKLRRLNPELDQYDSDEPLPLGMELYMPRSKSSILRVDPGDEAVHRQVASRRPRQRLPDTDRKVRAIQDIDSRRLPHDAAAVGSHNHPHRRRHRYQRFRDDNSEGTDVDDRPRRSGRRVWA